jgi:transcriptional regulator GlxA family with amidase domain
MLAIIGNRYGWEFAQVVADGFVHAQIRQPTAPQRRGIAPSPRTSESLVKMIVRTMENHVETPLSAEALATLCGTSERRMTRVFRSNFGDSPMKFYLRVRLQRARQLLFYSKMPIGDISLACGFSSPPAFNRAFRAQFAQSPRQYRAGIGTNQLRRFFPDYFRSSGPPVEEPASPETA